MYRDGNRTYHSLATCPPTCSGTLWSQVRDLGRSLTQQLWDIKLRDSTSARRLSSRCFFFFYAFLRVWYFLERAFVVTFLPRMVPPIYTHTHTPSPTLQSEDTLMLCGPSFYPLREEITTLAVSWRRNIKRISLCMKILERVWIYCAKDSLSCLEGEREDQSSTWQMPPS